jgi:hypothetical protein
VGEEVKDKHIWIPEIEWIWDPDRGDGTWTGYIFGVEAYSLDGQSWHSYIYDEGDSLCELDEHGKEFCFKHLRKKCYQEFLASPEWHRLREHILLVTPWCRDCGYLAKEVHHITYDNGWLCSPENLIALCSDCHDRRHK